SWRLPSEDVLRFASIRSKTRVTSLSQRTNVLMCAILAWHRSVCFADRSNRQESRWLRTYRNCPHIDPWPRIWGTFPLRTDRPEMFRLRDRTVAQSLFRESNPPILTTAKSLHTTADSLRCWWTHNCQTR